MAKSRKINYGGHTKIITVDGPSGAGKGTVCALLAENLGWALLDSGTLYRITGLAASRKNIAMDNETRSESQSRCGFGCAIYSHCARRENHLEGDDVTRTIRTEVSGQSRLTGGGVTQSARSLVAASA